MFLCNLVNSFVCVAKTCSAANDSDAKRNIMKGCNVFFAVFGLERYAKIVSFGDFYQ